MFHTYEQAVDWIHSRLRLGIKPGLKRMEWMMEKLGNPERKMKTIHIGGTNGKGSTLTFLRNILQEADYSVGSFTSPYFEQFNERISLDGIPISDEDILGLVNDIYPLANELEVSELGGPTEFEVITAMALHYFGNVRPVDIALFEVGLGGRFDSTNVIHPLLSIITSIGLDHTNILGETYEEIAFEKAGIIKSGTPLVTAVKQAGARQVIKQRAAEMSASVYELNARFQVEYGSCQNNGEVFQLNTIFNQYNNIEISMTGKHQIENASLAIVSAELLNKYYAFQIAEPAVRTGLKKAFWPGRFEVLSHAPLIVIDGAHNEEGIDALVDIVNSKYKNKLIRIIFAALSDKKLDNMIMKLDAIADKMTFIDFDFPRAARAEELFAKSNHPNKYTSDDWKRTIMQETNSLAQEEMLIITGSLYFLSAAKPFIVKYL